MLCSTAGMTLADDAFTKVIQPIFEKNCVQCHGENDKVKGRVNLLEIDSLSALSHDLELVSDLVDVIDFEEMPPEDELQIEPELRKQLLAELEAILEKSVSGKKAFSHAPIRRMNRFQYKQCRGRFVRSEVHCLHFA